MKKVFKKATATVTAAAMLASLTACGGAHSKLTHIAAELIVERANAEKEHIGLTTWDDATI